MEGNDNDDQPDWLRALKRRRVEFVAAGSSAQPDAPAPAAGPDADGDCSAAGTAAAQPAPSPAGVSVAGVRAGVLSTVPDGAVDTESSIQGDELVLLSWCAAERPWLSTVANITPAAGSTAAAQTAGPSRILQLQGDGLAAIGLAVLFDADAVSLAATHAYGVRASQQPLRRLRSNARLNAAALADGRRATAIGVHRIDWEVEAALAAARPTKLAAQPQFTQPQAPWCAGPGRAWEGGASGSRRAEGGRLHGPGSRCAEGARRGDPPHYQRPASFNQLRETMSTGWIRHQRWRQLHDEYEPAGAGMPTSARQFGLILGGAGVLIETNDYTDAVGRPNSRAVGAVRGLLACLRVRLAFPHGCFCGVAHAGPDGAERLASLERAVAADADGSFTLSVTRAPMGVLKAASAPAEEVVWLGSREAIRNRKRSRAGQPGRRSNRREAVAGGLPYALITLRWAAAAAAVQ